MSTYPCYIPPQTLAWRTFDALTSSSGIFYETLMYPATRSGSPHNALHSPGVLTYLYYAGALSCILLQLLNGLCFIKLSGFKGGARHEVTTIVAVLGRNRTLFRCVFRSHNCTMFTQRVWALPLMEVLRGCFPRGCSTFYTNVQNNFSLTTFFQDKSYKCPQWQTYTSSEVLCVPPFFLEVVCSNLFSIQWKVLLRIAFDSIGASA